MPSSASGQVRGEKLLDLRGVGDDGGGDGPKAQVVVSGVVANELEGLVHADAVSSPSTCQGQRQARGRQRVSTRTA